jgi:hypothetical protein
MRVALFGLVQMRNLCSGYRDWLASDAVHGGEAAREAGSVLARAGRRLMVRTAGGRRGGAQEWAKLLAKLDEVMAVLLEDKAAGPSVAVGSPTANGQNGLAIRAPVDWAVGEEAGSRLLRGWAAMARDTGGVAKEFDCALGACPNLYDTPVISASPSLSPLDLALPPLICEPAEWLWLLLVALRASSRVPSESVHQVAAAVVLPAALQLLPPSYAAVMGPSASAVAAAAATRIAVPAAPGSDAAKSDSSPVLVLVSTLFCGYACAAPGAVRSCLLSSLLGGALVAHPLPRLIAREAMARLMAGIAPGSIMPTLQALLDLATSLVAVGLPAARERAHTVELLAALVPHLPRPSLSCLLCALGEPLAPERLAATIRAEATVGASTPACATASSPAGPAAAPPMGAPHSTQGGTTPAGDATGHPVRSDSGARVLLSLFLLAELPSATGRRSTETSPEPPGPVAESWAGNDQPSAPLGCPGSSVAEALAEAGGSTWAASLAHASATAPASFAQFMLLGAASLVALLPPSVRSGYVQCARPPLVFGSSTVQDEAGSSGGTTRESAVATLSAELLTALAPGGQLAAAAAEAASVAALQLRTPTIEAIASAVGTLSLCGHDGRRSGGDGSVGGGIGRACLLVVSLLRRPLSVAAYDHLARLILRLASITAQAAAHAAIGSFPDGPAEQAEVSGCWGALAHTSSNQGAGCNPSSSWLGVHEAAHAASEFTTTANVESLGRLIEALRSQRIPSPSVGTRALRDSPAQPEDEHGSSLAAPLLEFLERADAPPDANTGAQVAREMALAVETSRRVHRARMTPPAEAFPAKLATSFKAAAGGVRAQTPRIPLHPLLPGAGPQPLAHVAVEPPPKRARLTAGLEGGLGMLSSGLAAVGKAAAVASQAERTELQARLRAHEIELHRVVQTLEIAGVGGIGM